MCNALVSSMGNVIGEMTTVWEKISHINFHLELHLLLLGNYHICITGAPDIQVSDTGAKNQGEPAVSVGSIRVECLIIRPLCVNVGNMLSPRYPDTAGAMSLSAGWSFS